MTGLITLAENLDIIQVRLTTIGKAHGSSKAIFNAWGTCLNQIFHSTQIPWGYVSQHLKYLHHKTCVANSEGSTQMNYPSLQNWLLGDHVVNGNSPCPKTQWMSQHNGSWLHSFITWLPTFQLSYSELSMFIGVRITRVQMHYITCKHANVKQQWIICWVTWGNQ